MNLSADGYVTISCREPVTGRPTGQLVMDYLTDAILSTRPTMIGNPAVSPDSQLITTIDHRSDGVTLDLQKVTGEIDNLQIEKLTTRETTIQLSTASGLEFLFDVKTTLNISSVAFFESQMVNGYDLFATASNMDDVLFLNLFSGN